MRNHGSVHYIDLTASQRLLVWMWQAEVSDEEKNRLGEREPFASHYCCTDIMINQILLLLDHALFIYRCCMARVGSRPPPFVRSELGADIVMT